MIQTIQQIFRTTLKHWREISTIYLVQLILGLIVTMVFYREMATLSNQSLALDQLAKGFDRTFLMDMIHSSDSFLESTKSIGIIILIVYLFVGAFMQAGWLANIRNEQFSILYLSKNGLRLVVPFLGIASIALMAVALIGGITAFIFTKSVGDPLVTFSSEKPYVLWIVGLSVLFVLWLITVWSWSVSARFFYIDGKSFLKSLRLGLHTLKQNFIKFQAIGLLIIGAHVLLMFVYYWIMGDRGAPSWSIVLFGIFVQQVFNYVRIVLRGLGYGFVENIV